MPNPLFLFFFLLISNFPAIQPATFPGDAAALFAFKSAVRPSSIPSSSCLASWNFTAADPCAVPRVTHFTCGVACEGNRIRQITLDSQGYAGTLSPAISKLTLLIALDLANNAFYGNIPPAISSLSNLKTLILGSNAFSGPIPPSIAKLSALENLDLSRNSLSAALPPNLNSLGALTRMDLSYNNLTGSLPKLPPNLSQLAVKANSLSGSLTRSTFAGLTRLMVIELSENAFSGVLESWLFLLPALQQVDLAKNALSGIALAKPNSNSELVAVNLSYNKIEGPLPAGFAEFPTLRSLAVSYNKFRGPIPWQYSKKGSPLRRLYLDGNFLNGNPPVGLVSGKAEISGSLGDNCLQNCPISSGLCSTPQKPNSICQQAYRGKGKPKS